MSKIFWDTMLFVYWFENDARYARRVDDIMSRMEERNDEWLTSALAVGETLAGPHKVKADALVRRMEEFFSSRSILVLPFTATAATHYAKIRAQFNVAPADAIHLACAAEAGVDLFLTNDKGLLRKHIPGIQFIDDLETRLF